MPRAGTLTTRSESTSLRGLTQDAQVRERVLDLGALVELRAADDLVGHVRGPQRLLEHARLGVDAVEDGDLAQVGPLGARAARIGVDDERRLVALVARRDDADGLARRRSPSRAPSARARCEREMTPSAAATMRALER